MKQATHILGHFEAGHTDYVSFCSAIMNQVTHITYDTLFGHYEAGNTLFGHFEAGDTDYVSFCSAIIKQVTHIT